MIIYILLSFLSAALCQFSLNTGIKPDVIFGDENERFDISSVINDQNRFYGVGQDFRRVHNVKGEHLLNALKDTMASMRRSNNDLKNTELFKKADNDFAYHDTMDRGGGTVEDFEMSLKKFKKEADAYNRKLNPVVENVDEDGRRTDPEPESEVLLNHALPVQLNVKGYLHLPLYE